MTNRMSGGVILAKLFQYPHQMYFVLSFFAFSYHGVDEFPLKSIVLSFLKETTTQINTKLNKTNRTKKKKK